MIYSRKRERVLDYVRSVKSHPTADEVYAAIRADSGDVSLATVYRNLSQLAESGQLRRIATAYGPDRFDGDLRPHYHAVCSCCGSVVDIPPESLPDLCKLVNEHTSMEITGMTLIFHGICDACKTSAYTNATQNTWNN